MIGRGRKQAAYGMLAEGVIVRQCIFRFPRIGAIGAFRKRIRVARFADFFPAGSEILV